MKHVGLATRTTDIAAIKNTAITNVRYVSTSGTATGDGSIARPFNTITNAQNSITDASPTKRYVINIAPGNYSEGAFTLKPNVFLVGDHYQVVRITTTSCGLDATWNATSGTDNRSGAVQVSFLSAVNFDFSTVSSAAGKLYFEDVTFGNTFTIKSFNSINQMMMDGCTLFSTMTFTGTTSIVTNTYIMGAVTINAATTANTWQHQFFSCRIQNNVTIIGTGNTASKQTHVWFISSNISNTLTATGDYTYVNLTTDSTPENFDKATQITGGAQVYFKNKSPYSPAYDGWYYSTRGASVPSTLNDAADNLATEAFNSWWSDNTEAVKNLRAYAIHQAQIGTPTYKKLYYDNFSDSTGFTITGTATHNWGAFIQGGIGTSTVKTNAITIENTSTSFAVYPIYTNGTVTFDYSVDGTTWTTFSENTNVTITAGSTTLYVRATLEQNKFLWGWAVLYDNG